MLNFTAVLGAGSGGKATAADLALQGKQVRLFEFPEYRGNIKKIEETRKLTATGAMVGEVQLELVTTDLPQAIKGADSIMICVQALAHERVATELAQVVQPDQIIILNPGSSGGACHFHRIFSELGLKEISPIIEFSTLTYGCRAEATRVDIGVKVNRVLYGCLPAVSLAEISPDLETAFPGLVQAVSVLEAGLNNANPVIHPPIALLNGARFENEGSQVRFYRDGVSPTVAHLIEKLDQERIALLRALGYPAQPDPVTSVEQGYATSTDYFECYAYGPVFGGFTAPDTLDHRYFHEDIGMGLVLYCSLGELLGIPTPTSEAFVKIGSEISGIDYFSRGGRTIKSLGLEGMSVGEIHDFLMTGDRS